VVAVEVCRRRSEDTLKPTFRDTVPWIGADNPLRLILEPALTRFFTVGSPDPNDRVSWCAVGIDQDTA
jgi:hypothetical protein